MKHTPKHREISRRLLAEIAAGRYPAGGRLPSEAQLVKEYHVSRPTVGRALLDLQRDGLIERRAGSGTYVCERQERLSGGRPLGLLIPGLGTTEIFELISGELAGLARAHDRVLLWGGSIHPRQDQVLSADQALKVCAQFIQGGVNGVFFAPFELTGGKEQTSRRIADTFRDAGIAVMLLDRDLLPFPQRSEFDLVGLDNLSAGHLLAEHLIKLGCERIAFVLRPLSAPTVDARVAGVREAIIRHGLELAQDWVQPGDPEDVKFVRRLAAGRRWDALVCANDHTAALLIRHLEAAGARVPQEVRVVGFDDAKFATLVSVPLTTVRQPCRDIAHAAFRAMLERIAEPTLPARNILLRPRLVVRESCGVYLPRADK
jgi:DNA-binding LacI/PurR family transcriptional regulator